MPQAPLGPTTHSHQPSSSHHTDHISPSPQLSLWSLQPGSGVGGGVRCLIAAGERHRELKIQFYSKAPPLPGAQRGLLEEGWQGHTRIPISQSTCVAWGHSLPSAPFSLTLFSSPTFTTHPPQYVPPSLPCPSHRNSSPSRNLPLYSTLFPEGVPSSPSVLLHACNLLPLSILGYSSPLLPCDLPQRQEYKSQTLTLLTALRGHCPTQQPFSIDIFISPILHMRRLGHREVK